MLEPKPDLVQRVETSIRPDVRQILRLDLHTGIRKTFQRFYDMENALSSLDVFASIFLEDPERYQNDFYLFLEDVKKEGWLAVPYVTEKGVAEAIKRIPRLLQEDFAEYQKADVGFFPLPSLQYQTKRDSRLRYNPVHTTADDSEYNTAGYTVVFNKTDDYDGIPQKLVKHLVTVRKRKGSTLPHLESVLGTKIVVPNITEKQLKEKVICEFESVRIASSACFDYIQRCA